MSFEDLEERGRKEVLLMRYSRRRKTWKPVEGQHAMLLLAIESKRHPLSIQYREDGSLPLSMSAAAICACCVSGRILLYVLFLHIFRLKTLNIYNLKNMNKHKMTAKFKLL